jgi:Flp pilus assembly protein TadG
LIRDDRGTAVVEFTLVSTLLLGLFVALVQLGLALHVRNTLVAAAAEGARVAAQADRSTADGERLTRQLIASGLHDSAAQDVAARRVVRYGVPVVEVEVRATLPLLGWAGPQRSLVVRGHAFDEAA